MTMKLLLLLPLLLMFVANAIAAVGAPGEARALGRSFISVAGSWTCYVAAAAASLGALVLLVRHQGSGFWFAVLAGILTSAAPLLWGRATEQFTASHHLVRAVLVIVVVVLCWFHVAVDR